MIEYACEPGLMCDHWYWRPGWREGRSFWTFHFTFQEQPEVAALAAHYMNALDGLDGLDAVPARWLHLTTQGLGFTDETPDNVVDQLIDAAQARCSSLGQFELTLGPVYMDCEAIKLATSPQQPLRAVRTEVRAAIGEVLGTDNVPEPENAWKPHVSIAYSNQVGDATRYQKGLTAAEPRTVTVLVDRIDLIALSRDNKMYEWVDRAHVRLA
jgi:2'-5' RNA ligase